MQSGGGFLFLKKSDIASKFTKIYVMHIYNTK